MTGLLRSELRRATSRRLVRLLPLALVASMLVLAGWQFATSESDLTPALERAREEVEECERFAREVGPGEHYPGGFHLEGPYGPDGRGDFQCPRAEDIAPHYDGRFNYAQETETSTRAFATVMLAMSFVIGASFVGADWGSGVTGTLLLWEPRRHRVLLAKAAVIGALAAAGAFVALGLLGAFYLPSGLLRGSMELADGEFWRGIFGTWARSGVLAGMFAMAGGAVAMMLRNTAGAITIGAVYSAMADPFLSLAWDGRLRSWLLIENVPRFQGYEVLERVEDGPYGATFQPMLLPVWRPALLLSVYVVALLALGYAFFRARDVT